MTAVSFEKSPNLEGLLAADAEARRVAASIQ
jgi:hypothetical protein